MTIDKINASTDGNQIVQCLWIGKSLSTLERLSIESFLANGHTVHLYIYDDVKNVPSGTTLKDANSIVPSSEIFTYSESAGEYKGNVAGFANIFRYKLLLEMGGWWIDTDTVCLKKFDFSESLVLSTERADGWRTPKLHNGIIKAEKNNILMRTCYERAKHLAKNPAQLKWGDTGYSIFIPAVKELGLNKYAKPPQMFNPITYWNIAPYIHGDHKCILDLKAPIIQTKIKNYLARITGDKTIFIGSGTYAIHMYNAKWAIAGLNKEGKYPAHSIYEMLKHKYLIS